ncbi:MAG: S46 family peptidase [Bacteroidales bacterium]|nr:S46 family peptidase [Bacteroidales bacterium]
MKKVFAWMVGFLLVGTTSLKADEGMWLLPLLEKLNMDKMTSMGLRLSAEDIYSINHSSLKDAIVIFGGGCTGEVVSAEGLLLTNHHCGFDAIQNHSSVEHDYLKDGFWAMRREEELPNPGLTATFLIRIEDVTQQILASLNDSVPEDMRSEKIKQVSREIIKDATAGNHYKATVRSFFDGNDYYLLVYEVYRDVRLVGAPPSSIGKFGYDTDNWMWPRHTCDFSVFRVYAGPDGKPAEYSTENIPLKPKHFFPVSLNGYEEGDFAMVMGYPGNTERYMTSCEVRELMEVVHPNRIAIRNLRQDIMMKDMLADPAINIKYASKYSRSSNYWKFSIGQSQSLKTQKTFEKKQQLETLFTAWVNEDDQRKSTYGDALNLICKAVTARKPYQHALQYTQECLYYATEIIGFPGKAIGLYNALLIEPDNSQKIDSLARELKILGTDFYNEYSVTMDSKVTPAILKLYREKVPESYRPEFFRVIESKYKGDIDKYSRYLFKRSIFAYYDKFNAFIQDPSRKALEKDMAFVAALTTQQKRGELMQQRTQINMNYEKGQRLFIAGLMEMQDDKIFYPDANSTMRLTYGTVQDYFPRDAVHYDYFTTLEGVMQKEDPDNREFMVPDKLKELYKNKDYGLYGVNTMMPVCFITNNDITGGNSGSPVLDADGNLIGLAFDGNWEAMTGDVIFEPELQRCICVDIRYVLFIMDKYAGAGHLVKEMKIIKR